MYIENNKNHIHMTYKIHIGSYKYVKRLFGYKKKVL